MALDHYLFDTANLLGRFVWRLYKWNPPAVSIGRNQRVREAVNREVLRRSNVHLVRRPTGGRAIWHSGDVCFTHVGVTPGKAESILAYKDDYMRATDVVVRFLGSLGIDAAVSAGRVANRLHRGPFKAPCFQSPGRYETVVGGKKIAGIAQYRSGERFLIQGSIRLSEMDPVCGRLFFGDDDSGIRAFARLRASVTSVEQELRREVGWDSLAGAFLTAVGAVSGAMAEHHESDIDVDAGRILDIERKKYGNSCWNDRL